MRTKFTDRYLRGLKPKAKRFQVMDSEVKGLGVVVFPSGVQSFFHVRKVMGRPDRRTLGPVGELTLDSARGVASGLNSNLADWRAKDFLRGRMERQAADTDFQNGCDSRA
jgi:hypothetical protein